MNEAESIMNEAESTTEQTTTPGCLSELEWLGVGFVLPAVSPTFYRLAAQRRVISAVIFFVLFGLIVSGLTTISVAINVFSVRGDVQQAFESGEFPEIRIEDGVATVEGPQPFVAFENEGQVVILDTTGTYRELDRSRYYQGFLLTRTSLHVLNRGEYQEIPLNELHTFFDTNPIIIDADSAARFWNYFSGILTVLAFIGLVIWYIALRFAYIVLLSLVVWGGASLIRRNTSFGPVLTTGLYAAIPAIYVHYLLGKVGVSFIGLFTLLLLPVWIVALIAALGKRDGGLLRGERPLRGWRALIGVPMLSIFALDVIFSWPKGVFVVWPVAALTFIVLVAVGLWWLTQVSGVGD